MDEEGRQAGRRERQEERKLKKDTSVLFPVRDVIRMVMGDVLGCWGEEWGWVGVLGVRGERKVGERDTWARKDNRKCLRGRKQTGKEIKR